MIYTILIALVLPQLISASCNVLYQLDDMSYCKMGQPYNAYRYYGCACSGIEPDKPIDGIDRCCQWHSQCYDYLVSAKKCESANSPYFCLYKWQCVLREPACNNDNKCLQSVCQCDEQFINCLSKYPYPTISKKCQYYEGDPILKKILAARKTIA
ncbi:unnamed protein product [Caenorhabditis brenneri]